MVSGKKSDGYALPGGATENLNLLPGAVVIMIIYSLY